MKSNLAGSFAIWCPSSFIILRVSSLRLLNGKRANSRWISPTDHCFVASHSFSFLNAYKSVNYFLHPLQLLKYRHFHCCQAVLHLGNALVKPVNWVSSA
jgi:hypothetical protein